MSETTPLATKPSDAEPSEVPGGLSWVKPPDPVIPAKIRPLIPLGVMLVMGLVIVHLFEDVRYYFQSGPEDLGSIEGGCDQGHRAKMQHNRYVRISGIYPQPSLTTEARVMFERRNYAFAMGCELAISVRVEDFRTIRDKRFALEGRLLRFRQVVSLDPVIGFYERNAVPIRQETFLLVGGETPRSKVWIFALMLALLTVFGLASVRFVQFSRLAAVAAREEEEAEEGPEGV